MSLTGAVASAVSGLAAASRSAQVISGNLANVMTEGYARRDVGLSANATGGVRVDGIIRKADPALIADYRTLSAESAAVDVKADFFQRVENIVGTADDAFSLEAMFVQFETALVSAASRPDQSDRLANAVSKAGALTEKFNAATESIQDARIDADAKINHAVDQINAGLQHIKQLNTQIVQFNSGGRDTAQLLDQRATAINSVAEFIPLREMARSNGAVALYSVSGALLLDAEASTLEFSRTSMITADMTLDNGLLSGLAINGVDVPVNGGNAPISSGKLAALFELRDETSVAVQTELDALARNLIERFEAPGLDPTVVPPQAALFTDAGSRLNPSDEIGLAGRIRVNAAVDERQGGMSWRMRDGLGAAVPSTSIGNAVLLHGFSSALSNRLTTTSGQFAGENLSSGDSASRMSSWLGVQRLDAEQNHVFASTRTAEARAALLENGVDSDQEMQKLLLVEQAYAANAQMLSTIDEMFDALMRIVR